MMDTRECVLSRSSCIHQRCLWRQSIDRVSTGPALSSKQSSGRTDTRHGLYNAREQIKKADKNQRQRATAGLCCRRMPQTHAYPPARERKWMHSMSQCEASVIQLAEQCDPSSDPMVRLLISVQVKEEDKVGRVAGS
mmetsp:Transcript_24133/g.59655  ORF Transcript_24133/g.59655 Transcript_24133/m.59655 type:complete len:137 (-) Transcript_24133:4377-4787(-)